jgi:CHAT domain-containing protein
MRSGLLFAGANNVWKGGEIPGELEDGVLTAYEVSGLDLFNTKLVTLSACETGLGDIQGTEGVYGLQRSFKMAGVDYLIMSLWQVPDKETQEFMELFYNNLTSGQQIDDAFRNTQRVMRQKYEPFYWAGFVLLE